VEQLVVASQDVRSKSKDARYLDSRGMRHMTHNKEWFPHLNTNRCGEEIMALEYDSPCYYMLEIGKITENIHFQKF
jgi:hypothetical protein